MYMAKYKISIIFWANYTYHSNQPIDNHISKNCWDLSDAEVLPICKEKTWFTEATFEASWICFQPCKCKKKFL